MGRENSSSSFCCQSRWLSSVSNGSNAWKEADFRIYTTDDNRTNVRSYWSRCFHIYRFERMRLEVCSRKSCIQRQNRRLNCRACFLFCWLWQDKASFQMSEFIRSYKWIFWHSFWPSRKSIFKICNIWRSRRTRGSSVPCSQKEKTARIDCWFTVLWTPHSASNKHLKASYIHKLSWRIRYSKGTRRNLCSSQSS